MTITLTILAFIILGLTALAGLVLAFIGFPGTWVILLGFILGDVAFPGLNHYRVWLVVLGVALAAEVVEWLLGYFGALKFGVSKKATWGAIAGSLVGALAGVGIPILGSLIGALVGAFLGAFAVEMLTSRQGGVQGAVRSGWGGLLARLAGMLGKTVFAVIMIIIEIMAMIK